MQINVTFQNNWLNFRIEIEKGKTCPNRLRLGQEKGTSKFVPFNTNDLFKNKLINMQDVFNVKHMFD